VRSGVRGPCLVLAVRLSCKDSLYRHLGVSPQFRVIFPVVVLDTVWCTATSGAGYGNHYTETLVVELFAHCYYVQSP